MNLRNNNRQIIKGLSRMSYRNSTGRNRVLIITVALVFITVFFALSLLYGRFDALYITNARASGSISSTTLTHPTVEQKKAIEELPFIEDTMQEWDLGRGMIHGQEITKCVYMSKADFDIYYAPAYSKITGDYPESENEIMMSKRLLSEFGITDPKPGMKIDIVINGDSKFVLSGFFEDYSSGVPITFMSSAYMNNNSVYMDENSAYMNSNPGSEYKSILYITDNLENQLNNNAKQVKDADEEIRKKVAIDNSEQKLDSSGNMNKRFIRDLTGGYELTFIVTGLILLCAYFLITSSLSMSVNKDIKFFGLLKVLGTTRSQLIKIVSFQIMKVCIWGMAIGLVVGSVLVIFVLPVLLEYLHSEGLGSFDLGGIRWPLLLLTVLFILIIVSLSSLRPVLKISSMSPVESAKGEKAEQQKSLGLSHINSIINKMALTNWTRGRNGLITAMLPMLLCFILVLCLISGINGLYLGYEKDYESTDFTLSTGIGDYIRLNEDNDPYKITDETVDEIEGLQGVTDVRVQRGESLDLDPKDSAWIPFLKAYDRDSSFYEKNDREFYAAFCVVDERGMDELESYIAGKKIKADLSSLKKGTGIFELHLYKMKDQLADAAERAKGQNVSVIDHNGQRKGEFEFLGYLNANDDDFPEIDNMSTSYAEPKILVSEKGLEKLGYESRIQTVDIRVDAEYEQEIKSRIEKMVSKRNLDYNRELGSPIDDLTEYIMLIAESDSDEQTERFNAAVVFIMNSLSFILIIMCLIQYFSVILTSYTARSKELSMLEKLGMTGRQIGYLLQREGLFFGIALSVLLCVVGSGILLIFERLMKLYVRYFELEFPFAEMGICIVVIIVISVCIPGVAYNITQKSVN